mgnify:CR=1 FL=1
MLRKNPYFCLFMTTMNIPCDIPVEKLPFMMGGLCLQEPMALITNWIIASVAFVLYYKLRPLSGDFVKNWRFFLISIGLSTFFGGLGHIFFQYTGFYGKIPSWVLGNLAAFFAGKAMISTFLLKQSTNSFLLRLLYFKFLFFTFLALYYESFTFVLIDTVITYLLFCLGYGLYYWRRKGYASFKHMIIGVIILISSAFIFVFELNLSLWLNKDDLSHLIIATTIIFFYISIKRYSEYNMAMPLGERQQHVDEK